MGAHVERAWKFLAAAILAASVMGPGVSPATAVQNFTDEAGQLLYTIDEQGIVSMFENSPGTDVTLSVTPAPASRCSPTSPKLSLKPCRPARSRFSSSSA